MEDNVVDAYVKFQIGVSRRSDRVSAFKTFDLVGAFQDFVRRGVLLELQPVNKHIYFLSVGSVYYEVLVIN